MKSSKKPVKTVSMPAGIAAGVLCALAATLCGAVITAKSVQQQWLEEANIGYAVMTILFLSAYLGSAVSCKKIKQKKLMVGLILGSLYYGLLLAMKILFFEGPLSGAGETAILIFGGSLLTLLINTENRKKYGRRKRHNR